MSIEAIGDDGRNVLNRDLTKITDTRQILHQVTLRLKQNGNLSSLKLIEKTKEKSGIIITFGCQNCRESNIDPESKTYITEKG